MLKLLKPIAVIILAVGVAAGAAIFLSRGSDQPKEAAADSSSPEPNLPAKRDGGHFRGPENAKITLVEFGDYQCPSCRAYYPLVNEILSRYPQQVRLEFHHYPLINMHLNSLAGTMAAEAAGEQGRY